jgi:hypothetical protein
MKRLADIPEPFDFAQGRLRESRASEPAGDLFPARPAQALRSRKHRSAPEIAAARVLCHQLKRKRISAEKKRIIHLICLNLVAILKRRSQQA